MTDRAFNTFRKRLLRRLLRKSKGVSVICKFPNDDVPRFLKRLDEFERRSAKTKLLVRDLGKP